MIFFLNWCKSDLKSYFPHIPHEFTSLIFGVLYGIFNDIFFWIRAFFDHKSSFPHIADEFTSVIFRINKGLSADFPEKFLPNFCIFIHPNSLTPTPNSPSAASQPSTLPVTVAFRASDSPYRALYPSRRGSLHNTPLIRSWLCTWAIVLYSDSFIKSLNISVWFFI